MALVVHKQAVQESDMIFVPKDAQFLTAHEQYGKLCIWYLCDPDKPKGTAAKRIVAYGTGQRLAEEFDHKYLATVYMHGGSLVLHLFEIVGEWQ